VLVQPDTSAGIICDMKAIAIAACAAASAAAVSAAPAASQPPSLRLVDTSPVTVAGQRFHAGERVRVVASGRVVARVVVRANGSFSVTLSGLAFDRCAGLSVAALGATGDRAVLTDKLPQPACPMAERSTS
jgi:hypothetical protein